MSFILTAFIYLPAFGATSLFGLDELFDLSIYRSTLCVITTIFLLFWKGKLRGVSER